MYQEVSQVYESNEQVIGTQTKLQSDLKTLQEILMQHQGHEMSSKLELQMLTNDKERLTTQCSALEMKLAEMKELMLVNEQKLEKQSDLIQALEKQNKVYEEQQESGRREM